ncbi:uncharacterized protein LOC111375836 [Olea europaea var. sylvestris]|uniref:uncharacterized protein LOC111375836 n=1 Tax=Olea europaea var. sylvestris TaxID=158386 RepID=UPI000C1D7238|nr:uncharacterized protein LOC111375836 [Olea europaea var. sylvestris]
MESVGAIYGGEWGSFCGMYSEEADFMAQLLNNCALPSESNVQVSGVDESTMYSSDGTNTNMYSFLQQSSYSGGSSILFSSSSPESYHPGDNHQNFTTNSSFTSIDYFMIEGKDNNSRVQALTNDAMDGCEFLNQDMSNDSIESSENQPETVFQKKSLQLGREYGMPTTQPYKEDKVNSSSEMSKERSRIPGELTNEDRALAGSKIKNL